MVSLATEHAPPNVVQEGDGSLRVDLTTDGPMAAQESLYILHEQADCLGSDIKVGNFIAAIILFLITIIGSGPWAQGLGPWAQLDL